MFQKSLSETLGCGSLEFSPFVVFEKTEAVGSYEHIPCKSGYIVSCDTADYNDVFYITECAGGYTVKRVFKNTSGKVVHLRELGVRLNGICFGGNSKKDYYYHVDNPRIFRVMTLSVDCDRVNADAEESEFDPDAGNKWGDPGVITERVGNSPYQPFPAVLLSNPSVKFGVVHGSLSQNVFYHNYHFSHSGECVVMNIYSSFKDIEYREVKIDEVLTDEWFIGRAEHADDLERVFEEYTVQLRKKLPANYGASSINRDNMVWGTWNDGVMRTVNEELIITEARELVEHFPNVKWLQIDDGYSALEEPIAHGIGVPYEGEDCVHKKKFPHGMRYVTDKIREIGLRPALWIGGSCPKKSKISQEYTEIMIEYASRTDLFYVIDVSNPKGREYMTKAIDKMILDWGFDGVKHDFWSYAFEVSEPLLKSNEASGYEYRDWWLKELRKRLPSDGYLQTGCDIVMANPFLGKYFTNYRYGIDIGSGKWNNIKTNFLWAIACLATHTGDLFVPNSDSIGLFPGLSDIDAAFCVNFVLITRTMVELAGVFSKVNKKDNQRFAMLKKATCNVNNGQDVYLAGYDYRTAKDRSPDTIYIKTPHFSKECREGAPIVTFALFNVDETDNLKITVKAQQLGLDPQEEYVLTDVWSGDKCVLSGEKEFELVPHESRLIAVNRAKGKQIYDANIELSEISASEDKISAKTHYASSHAEITLSDKVSALLYNGKAVEFSQIGDKIVFALAGAGLLEIII